MENLLLLGVTILKQIMVVSFLSHLVCYFVTVSAFCCFFRATSYWGIVQLPLMVNDVDKLVGILGSGLEKRGG